MKIPSYKLVTHATVPDLNGIECLICGLTSWNPGDVANRYCVRCHQFHEDFSEQIDFQLRSELDSLNIDLDLPNP